MVQRTKRDWKTKSVIEFSTSLSDREDPAFGATSLATKGTDLTFLSHSTAMVAWFCSFCFSFECEVAVCFPKAAKSQSIRVLRFLYIKFFCWFRFNFVSRTWQTS